MAKISLIPGLFIYYQDMCCRYGVLPDSLQTGEGKEKDEDENKIMEEVARYVFAYLYINQKAFT